MARINYFIGAIALVLANYEVSAANTASAFEPQVAVLCESGTTYHPQFMTSAGRWQVDLSSKPQLCLRDKMEILDYCKKMYPTHDITNIVEASHYVEVSNWCKIGSNNPSKCKTTRWVKPFRCLEGPFQSDALLVPENCLFDHIHNQSKCWQFSRWNLTAGRACAQRGLKLRTFAMLLPCGISLFSGVEFVCCPKHYKDKVKIHKWSDTNAPMTAVADDSSMMAAAAAVVNRDDNDDEVMEDDIDDDDTLNLNDDDDDDDDDEDDDDANDDDLDDDEDLSRADGIDRWDEDYTDDVTPSSSTTSTTTTTTTTTTSTTQATPTTSDPYYSHFDPDTEHQSYKDAQQRLEESHREKITKVMKEWSELEEQYQDMLSSNPQGAAAYRQKMTAKFQAQVQELEEQGVSERRQLAALHQQRVRAHLAQRRRYASSCYARALADQQPNPRRVQKCLQRLIRALNAERSEAMAAWKRAVASGREAAAAVRPGLRDDLVEAARSAHHALDALRARTPLFDQIGTAIQDYIESLQSKDDSAVSFSWAGPEADEELLSKVESAASRRAAERGAGDVRRAKMQKLRAHLQQERARVAAVLDIKTSETDDEAAETEQPHVSPTVQPTTEALPTEQTTSAYQPTNAPVVSTWAPSWSSVEVSSLPGGEVTSDVSRDLNEVTHELSSEATGDFKSGTTRDTPAARAVIAPPAAPAAHALRHDINHPQPSFNVIHEESSNGRALSYPALLGAGGALGAITALALALYRRRTPRRGRGFVQVEQTVSGPSQTPEERHVANMQINGYENPTYKYFEVKE